MRSVFSSTAEAVAAFAAMSAAPPGGAPGTDAASIFSAVVSAFSEQPARSSTPERSSAAGRWRGIVVKIGRATCRERVCQYVYITGVAGALKKRNTKKQGSERV